MEAVQQKVASLVGIPVAEQILIHNGTPLDPRQPLGTYRLPVSTLQLQILSVFYVEYQQFLASAEDLDVAERAFNAAI